MKRKLTQALFAVGMLGVFLTWSLWLALPPSLELRLWLLVGVSSLIALLAWYMAGTITKNLVKTLSHSHLDALEGQGLYEELRPIARRLLEESRSTQKLLQKQNAELRRDYEKQDRIRRDFTANVSHELKTPLTSISGYAELMHGGLVKPEDIGRFAGRIYSEADRMIRLVEDILKLSELDEGYQIRHERSSVDVSTLVQEEVQRLTEPAQQQELCLHLDIENGCFVWGVEQILGEIFYNLLDNAIKYNRPRGEIWLSLQQREKKVLFSLRDTGIGISEEDQERIFERFYRVDKSRSKEIGGTGLGLSIVKHAVLYHDASISVESKAGEGTQFRVSFHAYEEEHT